MRRGAQVIKVGELGTTHVEHAREMLDERPRAIGAGDGEPARTLSHVGICHRTTMEVADRMARRDGAP